MDSSRSVPRSWFAREGLLLGGGVLIVGRVKEGNYIQKERHKANSDILILWMTRS